MTSSAADGLPAGLPADVDVRLVKAPHRLPASGRDPAVAAKVSEMLLRIEREGMDAVRAYSRELDDWAEDLLAQRWAQDAMVAMFHIEIVAGRNGCAWAQ